MLTRSTRSSQYTAKGLLEAWKALPKSEQIAFLGNLVKTKRLREELEDLIDIAICEERSKEPTRPLEEVLRERRGRVRHKKA